MEITRSKAINLAVIVLVGSAIFYFASRTFLDSDLFWHLKAGLDHWHSRAITTVDPYSFLTFDRKWIDPERLFNCIIAIVFGNFHLAGLVALKTIIALLIISLLAWQLKEYRLDPFGAGIFLISAAVLLSPATNLIRPHNISCLMMTILFIVLKHYRKYLVFFPLLPLLFIFWANLHGGFIAGLGTLTVFTVLYTIYEAKSEPLKQNMIVWLSTLFCFVAIIINPYGYTLIFNVVEYCLDSHPDNIEWQPIKITSGLGLLWLLTVLASLLALAKSKQNKDRTSILLWLAFCLAPLISLRHIAFFGPATLIFMGEHLTSFWQTYIYKPKISNSWNIADILFIMISIVTSIFVLLATRSFYFNTKMNAEQQMPYAAAGLIKKANLEGNLLLRFDWGGYAIWHLYPKMKVSFDGRRETAYSQKMEMANINFNSGEGEWDYILNKFPVAAVLIATASPAYNLMKLKPDWQNVYEDKLATLFLPATSDKIDVVKRILSDIPEKDREKQLALPDF